MSSNIAMSLEKPENFGIPKRFHEEWYKVMLEGFAINKELTARLDELLNEIDKNYEKANIVAAWFDWNFFTGASITFFAYTCQV